MRTSRTDAWLPKMLNPARALRMMCVPTMADGVPEKGESSPMPSRGAAIDEDVPQGQVLDQVGGAPLRRAVHVRGKPIAKGSAGFLGQGVADDRVLDGHLGIDALHAGDAIALDHRATHMGGPSRPWNAPGGSGHRRTGAQDQAVTKQLTARVGQRLAND